MNSIWLFEIADILCWKKIKLIPVAVLMINKIYIIEFVKKLFENYLEK